MSNEIAEDLKEELCFGLGSMLDGIKMFPGAPIMVFPNISKLSVAAYGNGSFRLAEIYTNRSSINKLNSLA
jgi:hypothetical protein